MKEVTKDVKTGKIVDGIKKQVKVGEVTCPIYESVDELVANVKAETLLGLFNKANVIRLQGNERAKHQDAKAGKTKHRAAGYALIDAQIVKFAGKFLKLQEFLDTPGMQEAAGNYIANETRVDDVAMAAMIDEFLAASE